MAGWAPGLTPSSRAASPHSPARICAHDRRAPAVFCRTDIAAGPAQPAGAVVAIAGDAAAAAAHRISADAAVVRHHAEAGNAGAHAVVAHIAAPDGGGAGDPGR